MSHEDERPDPESLLRRISEEEKEDEAPARGRLKIFLSYTPGAGKTFRMLQEAHVLRQRGVDVVVALVETHGRAETEALLQGLEVLPRRQVNYRGLLLQELDLDAVLARKPQVAIVDELAHTNAPGSRHVKRYQDVQELLANGISVYTALNIQHVETVADLVQQITGIRVQETVPDAILEEADEIELVDIPPEELLQRLAEGKVYVPERAREAMRRFFRRGNLLALREIALRYTARQVDKTVREYMERHMIPGPWPTGVRLLVSVSPSPLSERLVRTAARLARDLDAEWFAVSVSLPRQMALSPAEQQRLDKHLQLAQSLGAQIAVLSSNSVAEAILDFARKHNVSLILVGPPLRPAWQELLFGSVVYELIRRSQGIDVMVLSSKESPPPARLRLPTLEKLHPLAFFKSAVVVSGGALVLGLLDPWLKFSDQVLLMLVPVFVSALFWGETSGVAATLLALVLMDLLFVPPKWSFDLSDLWALPTLLVFAGVGITFSVLLGLLRRWERRVRQREHTLALLYQFSQRLIQESDAASKQRSFLHSLHTLLQRPVVLFFPDQQGELTLWERTPQAPELSPNERAVATWVYDHQQPAGAGSATLSSVPWYFFPLVGERKTVGVVGVYTPDTPLSVEELTLIEPMARMAALALEEL